MEAWIKFQASGVTLSIGLNIGKLVFNALNKVEWVLAISIIINQLIAKNQVFSKPNLFYLLTFFLLLLQTIYVLPELDSRAEMIIRGEEVLPSKLHLLYVVIEVVKVISLFIYGISNFKVVRKVVQK